MRGRSPCHTSGVSLTGLVKARTMKLRRTVNGPNFAGLIPVH